MKLLSSMLLWFIAIFFSGAVQSMTDIEDLVQPAPKSKIEKKYPLSRSGSYSPDIFYDKADNECQTPYCGKILSTHPFIFTKTNADGSTEAFKGYKSLSASDDKTGREFKDSKKKAFMLYGIKKLESN